TAQYDQKSYAVKFSSFHNDVEGVVIRGYDDNSQPEDNADMMIHVWADDNGLPGANMIVPFSVPNPATLSETNAWVYVDLHSYTALDEMVGDYFIGFECGTSPATGVTRTTMTDTVEASEFDFGRAYTQYYALNGADLKWEQAAGYNYHIRCITTDYGIAPGIIDPDPVSIYKQLGPVGSGSSTLYVNNIGGWSLDYIASIEYDGFLTPASTLHSNDFTTFPGAGYTYSVWAAYNSGARTTGSGATGVLTSPTFNTTGATTDIYLEFDQDFIYRSGSYARVEYYTGTEWIQIYYNATASTSEHQRLALPVISANTQIRFTGYTTRVSGITASWFIDNVVVSAEAVPYTWLTLDGGETTSGTVAVSGSDPIFVGFNTAGLEEGAYTANIRLNSQYSNESVPVRMDVVTYTLPEVPALVSPTNGQTLYDLTPYFDWTDVSNATAYNIVVDNNSDFLSPEINTEVSVSNYQQASNLPTGTYYWKVRSRNEAGYSAFTGNWTVNISFYIGPPLNPPGIYYLNGNIFINWDDTADATSYNVYSSENPYGTFTFLNNVTVSEYTYTEVGTHPRMFFFITSVNDTKEPQKMIEIPKKVK
ncbi:TPA: hypothetical protein DCR49_00600, partial [Candidatus Delongbacteria bacterium]|nr:hypothetical protein [Candidatus Delongbacteria bacterium]